VYSDIIVGTVGTVGSARVVMQARIDGVRVCCWSAIAAMREGPAAVQIASSRAGWTRSVGGEAL